MDKEDLAEIIKHVEDSLHMHGARAYYDTAWIEALLEVAKQQLTP